MKNTGLKIPEKDQSYVEVGFSCYLRAKIIGEFYCSLVDAFKKLEETRHVLSTFRTSF